MPLLEQPELVALYRDLGVRQIHLAYNRNNSVADGCHDVERGLTPLGRRVVDAVNDAGLLMDCSHTGRRCSLDIMAASARPVIFSHSNPLALVEHGRNVTDEQIRACAATGGVVCVSGVSIFLGTRQPAVDDVARHAAYVAELVGRRTRRHRARHQLPPGRHRRRLRRAISIPATGGRKRRATTAPSRAAPIPPIESWQVLASALERTGMTARRSRTDHGRQHAAGRAAGLAVETSGVRAPRH